MPLKIAPHAHLCRWLIPFMLLTCKTEEATVILDSYCQPTLEYRTTLDYLRETKAMVTSETEARSIAARVADGCQGAAERFVNTVELLSTAKLPSHLMVQKAVSLAQSTEEVAESFVVVFRYAFLASHLDLDALAALKLADSLSTEFKGNAKRAQVDFSRLLDFCLSTLQLAKPACGDFAAEVTRFGEKLIEIEHQVPEQTWFTWITNHFEDDGLVSRPYFDFFAFLTSEGDGPRLATHDAHKMALKVLGHNPLAGEEFKEAYLFASDKSGLQMDRSVASDFALGMSQKMANLRLTETSRLGL
jgi:hypothetical protein